MKDTEIKSDSKVLNNFQNFVAVAFIYLIFRFANVDIPAWHANSSIGTQWNTLESFMNNSFYIENIEFRNSFISHFHNCFKNLISTLRNFQSQGLTPDLNNQINQLILEYRNLEPEFEKSIMQYYSGEIDLLVTEEDQAEFEYYLRIMESLTDNVHSIHRNADAAILNKFWEHIYVVIFYIGIATFFISIARYIQNGRNYYRNPGVEGEKNEEI